jgi:2-polyprenyl-3-methyl-5-hydroxy-6-metoxy-1,4-benzoquinol methylase
MTISQAYRALQSQLHRDNPEYGVASVGFAPMVADLIRQGGVKELLDYGAGKGRLGQELARILKTPPAIHHYDPAIEAWAATPKPTEMVACIDVLEHIEPEYLDRVLDDLARLVRRVGVFTVHTGPAAKHLADGRNAHLIQEPPRWWLPKILARFELLLFQQIPNGFIVVVRPMGEAGAAPAPP